MIAVVGATGNTGRAVVKELRQLGQHPVCIVRTVEKARDVLGADAKTAVAELTDRAALEKALQGVASVFVTVVVIMAVLCLGRSEMTLTSSRYPSRIPAFKLHV